MDYRVDFTGIEWQFPVAGIRHLPEVVRAVFMDSA
jgi:hypothetical protein